MVHLFTSINRSANPSSATLSTPPSPLSSVTIRSNRRVAYVSTT